MTLPTWLNSQIAAAQAEAGADGTTWSVYVTTDNGVVLLAGAHDRADAQRWLDESRMTGLVAHSPRTLVVDGGLSDLIALGGAA
jgi:hypothetical protein